MPAGWSPGLNKEQALDRALELFWTRGYEGTSITDLTDAIGVSRPSLYAAFGDKEQLFRAVLAHYLAGPGSYVQRALEQPHAVDAIRTLLTDAAAAVTLFDRPPGCLVVHGALASGEDGAVACDLLQAERLTRQAAIRARLERGAGEGELPAGTDVVLLTEYVTTTLHGMAVQALAGASREALTATADFAMRVFALGEAKPNASSEPATSPERTTGKRATRRNHADQIAMEF
jgi:AcrR family transcriptional regulator